MPRHARPGEGLHTYEMQVRKALEFDRNLHSYLGSVTAEVGGSSDSTVLADHALVFMLRGITTNWKQVVAYFFTGASVNGSRLWQLAKQIIYVVSNAGVVVRAVVSDMGSSNQAMWRAAGICANRNSVACSIQHPVYDAMRLYFLADIPHILKNVRNCMLTQDIVLPPDVLQTHSLLSPRVKMQHVAAVVELQQDCELKIAPALSTKHVQPGQYQKMRVSTAAQVLSHSTASALRYLVSTEQLPQDALTTAWFVDFVNAWFDIVNGRCFDDSLRPAKCDKIQVLHKMLAVARNLTFSGKHGGWKPIQTRLLLSTHSILLGLYNDLVICGSYKYLLAGRLTQGSRRFVLVATRTHHQLASANASS